MRLTIAYITSREAPHFHWFMDSLSHEMKTIKNQPQLEIIVVDALKEIRAEFKARLHPWWAQVRWVEPKPTIWQGKHRITKEDWWANSNARNTAFALCRTKWIAFLDDRCVLMPGWLDAIRRAMEGNYCVLGAYEKRVGMLVDNGVICHGGIVTGMDDREKYCLVQNWKGSVEAPGAWLYGCSFALPLEWALSVGGFPEVADGLGMEDVLFGMLLQNNGYALRYDPNMKMIEDRTPEQLGTVMRREDKGVSPEDKSHALLHLFLAAKNAGNSFSLRDIREDALAGKPFPVQTTPKFDWYDSTPIT